MKILSIKLESAVQIEYLKRGNKNLYVIITHASLQGKTTQYSYIIFYFDSVSHVSKYTLFLEHRGGTVVQNVHSEDLYHDSVLAY